MCNVTTPYHEACGHYGGPRVGVYCIKALAQPGHTRGCDERSDGGVENAEGLCKGCENRQAGRKGSRGVPAIPAQEAIATLPSTTDPDQLGTSDRAASVSSTSSSASSLISRAEAAGYARSLVASLPSSIPTVRRNASGVGLPVSGGESGKLTPPPTEVASESRSTLFKTERAGRNMHWRAFDGRAYADEGVIGIVR